MYDDPEISDPEDISSDTIFNTLEEASNCRYKSCNPITSFDFGDVEISIIGSPPIDFLVEVILTGFRIISPLS